MELRHASNQWASRPADEQFASLEEMHQAVDGYRKISAEKVCLASELTVEVAGDRPVLLTPASKAAGRPVDFTNYSFGQLARLVSAPAGYLAGLPAPLAAECMNLGLQRRAKMEGGREQLKAYIAQNGITELRAMTSTSYARIYDVELTTRLLALQASQGGQVWAPARPTFRQENGGGNTKPALWASDRDLFAFMVSDRRISARGADVARGFMLWNSEVGDASIGGCAFLYDNICGNFIVWGAKNVREFRFRHVGENRRRAFGEWEAQVRRFADSSAQQDQERIETLQRTRIAATKEELLDGLFRQLGVTKDTVATAYQIAERTPRYGDPLSAWGMINGLTEASQLEAHTADRVAIDRAAAKIADRIVF